MALPRIAVSQLESKDLTLAVKLDIDLATELADSLLDGCVRFKASPSLEQRDPKTAAAINTTGALRGPDGLFSIKVGGHVGQRKLMGQACELGEAGGDDSQRADGARRR